MKEEIRISLLIKFVNHGFKRALDNNTEKVGLTGSQCQIMGFLDAKKCMENNIYPADLEKEFHMTKPTVSGLLKRMEEKGFIKFDTDVDDKRRKIIRVTDKSNEIKKFVDKNFDEVESFMMQDISKEDYEQVQNTLFKMLENINKYNNEHDKH